MTLAPRMNRNSVSSIGVQVRPTSCRRWQHDRVADELDDDFERVHEPGRHQPLLADVAAHGPGDDHEHDAATIHSISTCLVTEKSMPKIFGR